MTSMIIVDDESFIRECLKNQIEWHKNDIKVEGTARNGEEAIELIRNIHPQIVLTDVRMPKMNGIMLMERAREIDGDIEFVFISGFQEFEYVKKALDYGSCGYVLKPIDPKELMEITQKAVLRVKEKKLLAQKPKNFLKEAVYGTDIEKLPKKNVDDMYRVLLIYYNASCEIYDSAHLEAYKKVRAFISDMLEKMQDGVAILEDNPRLIGIVIKGSNVKALTADSDKWLQLLKIQVHQSGVRCYRIKLSRIVSSIAQLKELYFEMNREILADLYHKIHDEREEVWLLGKKMLTCIDEQDKEGLAFRLEELKGLLEEKYRTIEEKQDILYAFVKWILANFPGEDSACRFSLDYLSQNAAKVYSARRKEDFEEAFRRFCGTFVVCFTENQTAYGKEGIIEEAKDYIKKHYGYITLSLTDISEQINVSPNYLSAVFSGGCQCSITSYINKVRIEEAKKLLEHSSLKINMIAEKVGYENATYFSTIFKKHTGVSPKEYRSHKREQEYE